MRLLAVDMDGTLLASDGRVPKANADAICMAQEQGKQVIVCTGRGFRDALVPVREAGIVCDFICMNGAGYFRRDGKLEYKKTLSYQKIDRIVELAEKFRLVTDFMAEDGSYTISSKAQFLKCYTAGILLPMAEFELDMVWKRFKAVTYEQLKAKRIDIFKVSVIHQDPNVLKMVQDILEKEGGLALAPSHETNIEITSDKAQKGIALMEYARKHQIPNHEIMAIGDSGNDVSMLRLPIGVTVAMGNAMPAARAAAMYQTKTNDENGVAEALKKWFL